MKQAMSLIAVAIILGSAAVPAFAHPFELGITIEPSIAGLPAFADSKSIPTTAITAGGGVGFEFAPLKYLALTTRVAYVHALSDSKIGEASIGTLKGTYYVSQDAAYALVGVRLETPIWWIPVQFFLSPQGGIAILIQDQP